MPSGRSSVPGILGLLHAEMLISMTLTATRRVASVNPARCLGRGQTHEKEDFIVSDENYLPADGLEQLHLSDNGFSVSSATVIEIPPAESEEGQMWRLLETGFVLRIETHERPEASPFHFWMTAVQFRRLIAESLNKV